MFFLSEEQCCLKKSVIFASNLLQAVKEIPTVKRRYLWATLVGTKAELKKSCILAFALDSNPIVGGESGYNETESSAAIKDMLSAFGGKPKGIELECKKSPWAFSGFLDLTRNVLSVERWRVCSMFFVNSLSTKIIGGKQCARVVCYVSFDPL